MTTSLSQNGTHVETVTVTFAEAQARELSEVLPWVLHALEDRPGLTAKQRRRREVTKTAIDALLAQLVASLPTHAPAHPAENST